MQHINIKTKLTVNSVIILGFLLYLQLYITGNYLNCSMQAHCASNEPTSGLIGCTRVSAVKTYQFMQLHSCLRTPSVQKWANAQFLQQVEIAYVFVQHAKHYMILAQNNMGLT